jgi:hypothetical protein
MEADLVGRSSVQKSPARRGFYFEFTGIYRESALLPETESG